MCINEREYDTGSSMRSSVSEFKDNNVEDIVIGELIAVLC